MIGDLDVARAGRLADAEFREIFGNVFRERRDLGRFVPISGVCPQHEAIILDGGAAARRRHQDRVEPLAADLAGPDIDIVFHETEGVAFTPHVVRE